MTPTKKQYSAKDLADMRLDGLPTAKKNMIALAERENWAFEDVTGRGGKRREYTPPNYVVGLIKARLVDGLMSVRTDLEIAGQARNEMAVHNDALPIAHAGGEAHLSTHQANVEGARRMVLAAIDRVNREAGVSREAAMTTMLTQAKCGVLEPTLEAALRLARDKRGAGNGKDAYPSIRTIKGWRAALAEGTSLAPSGCHFNMSIPAWAHEFLKFYQRPQKPSVADAHEDLLDSDYAKRCIDEGVALPSVHQCRRFLDKMGNVSREVGRMGAREIKNIKGFRRRGFDHMMPNDVWSADGHKFDAEVAHPYHKRPFRPEITVIVDIATRKAVGWSVDLAESGFAVLDAIRHGVVTHGLPAIFYVDNGSGYKNAMMNDRSVGLMGRLGVHMEHSIAYNSQARGVIEAFHKNLIKAAKRMPTYIGAPMDRQAMQLAHKITRKALKDDRVKTPLMSFEVFVAYLNDVFDKYNNRVHRSLKNQTPNELWARKAAEGFNAITVNENEAVYMFRPQMERTVRRCEVALFGNTYYDKALEEFHGDRVKVAYDIHDGSKVWVYSHLDVLICVAGFEANKDAYMPQSAIEHGKDKRLAGREKRLMGHLDEVYAERGNKHIIEMGNAQVLEIPGIGRFDKNELEFIGQNREACGLPAQPAMTLRVVEDEPKGMEIAGQVEHARNDTAQAWKVPPTGELRYPEYLRLTIEKEKGVVLDENQETWLRMYPKAPEFKVMKAQNEKAS